MDGKVVRKLREDHKRILSERYSGVDCFRLDNQSERTRIRVYLAYVWQSHLQPFIMVRACRHDHNASDRQSSGNPISVAGISG